MAQTAAVTVDEFLHDVVVSHLHDGRHTAQTFDILLTGVRGIHVLHVAVVRLAQIGLRHIEAQQRVQVVGHSLGELNDFLVAALVGHHQLVRFVDVVIVLCVNLRHYLTHRCHTGHHQGIYHQ